jgi:hypothetical protein
VGQWGSVEAAEGCDCTHFELVACRSCAEHTDSRKLHAAQAADRRSTATADSSQDGRPQPTGRRASFMPAEPQQTKQQAASEI